MRCAFPLQGLASVQLSGGRPACVRPSLIGRVTEKVHHGLGCQWRVWHLPASLSSLCFIFWHSDARTCSPSRGAYQLWCDVRYIFTALANCTAQLAQRPCPTHGCCHERRRVQRAPAGMGGSPLRSCRRAGARGRSVHRRAWVPRPHLQPWLRAWRCAALRAVARGGHNNQRNQAASSARAGGRATHRRSGAASAGVLRRRGGSRDSRSAAAAARRWLCDAAGARAAS